MSALPDLLKARISADGPISIAEYMGLCLGHPEHGYYTIRDPLGAAGDFTTAPEISQMFGELMGLWLAQAWMDRGAPERFVLAELGPGRGTLMADALRAAARVPGFREAATLWLVETSPTLRHKQWETLGAYGPNWANRIEELPTHGPLFAIANEFFDALPIRQFVVQAGVLHERVVGLESNALTIGLTPPLSSAGEPPEGIEEGRVFETCPAGRAIAGELGARLSAHGGAALILDYGHDGTRHGDTFQAVRAHAYADPLADPGAADLTAHVDFGALERAAREGGATGWGLREQGALLDWLGIRVRAAMLAKASPERAAEIDAARVRLTGEDAMGRLFKALALSGDEIAPPGFAEDLGA